MNATSGCVAVAIPAYNEAAGIAGFLTDIDGALHAWAGPIRFVVVDDASTDGTAETVAALTLRGTVDVVRNDRNRGHGPTLMRAYRRALEYYPEFVWHVDGDGQFDPADFWNLHRCVTSGADVAVGVRRQRVDPFYRKAVSASLRIYLRAFFGVRSRDANSPFRLYRSEVLRRLLYSIPDDALIPSVYLTVVAARTRTAVSETAVAHFVRRGGDERGTMWRGQRIPIRFIRFSYGALRESVRLRRQVVHSAPSKRPE